MNRRGMTMLEIMMALMIVGVAMFGILSTVNTTSQLMGQEKVLWARTRILNSLASIAGMPATIRASMFQNIENIPLTACVNGGGDNPPCAHLGPYQPFRLYLPMVDRVSQWEIVTSGAVAGTPHEPIRYNSKGESCDTKTDACPQDRWPIEAFTEFSASCPPIFDPIYDDILRNGNPYYGPIHPAGLAVPAECPAARFIKVRLTIRSTNQDSRRFMAFKPFVKVFAIDVERIQARVAASP
jgi:prepilin-type N-terminal cleavage/methylation domain-containing protein